MLTNSARLCRPCLLAGSAHPAATAGFSIQEGEILREKDCLLEGDGLELLVPQQESPGFPKRSGSCRDGRVQYKNAMKGFGFFVGGLLLQLVGFHPALWLMAGMLGAVLIGVVSSLPTQLGKAKASKSFGELFAKSRAINLISAARVFLFGSRDVWFVVGLPVFLYANGWKYIEVAGFIAAWTIGYGFVQAVAPSVIRRSPDGLSREIPEARLWGAILAIIPAALAVLVHAHVSSNPGLLVVIGLSVFGFAFSVISSLHSYLVLAYAGSKKAAEDVGFYYAPMLAAGYSASCCRAR
jgi:hypothetical protein